MQISNSELAILGLLAENPKHGYQIEQDIQSRGMREWTDIAFSSIYHLLNKLESTGWLESSRHDTVDRPARKVYRLSSEGWSIYTSAVRARLSEPRPNTGDFALALANLGCLSRAEIVVALQENLSGLQRKLKQVQRKHSTDQQSVASLPWFVSALFDYSQSLLVAEAEFVERLLRQLNAPIASGE